MLHPQVHRSSPFQHEVSAGSEWSPVVVSGQPVVVTADVSERNRYDAVLPATPWEAPPKAWSGRTDL